MAGLAAVFEFKIRNVECGVKDSGVVAKGGRWAVGKLGRWQ